MHFKKELYLKNKIIFIILAFIITFLAGCFHNHQKYLDNSETTQQTDKNNTQEDIKFVRKDKNVIRVCQRDTPPASLDPIYFDNKLDELTFHIFDRLVKWDSKGNIIPDLAENWRQLDDKTIQFKLRRGIKFHNGETFDANSVKFSIERLIDPKTKSPGYHLFKTISKVTIVDPYTINIITSQPDYLFIRKLALVQILPQKYFTDTSVEHFGQYPIGTGAYKFKERQKDGSIVLTKNEHYWREGKPIIKTVIFKFIEVKDVSRTEQLNALFKGKIDLVTELPGIYSLKVQKNPRTKVIKRPNQAKVYRMLFNSMKEPFSNLKVRKAVNLALNRDILIKVLAKGNGRKIATNSVKIEFGHNDKLQPYPYDPKEAKKLLKESGYENISIKIAVTDEANLIAQAVKKDLERIDIKAEFDTMTISEMAKRLSESKLAGPNDSDWDYDLTIYSGVDPFLHVGFLYGMAVYSQGSWSKTNSPEVDKIYRKLEETLDETEQFELCLKLEDLTYHNHWYTPVFQVIGTYGASNDLVLKDSATTFVDLTEAYFKEADG